MLTYLATRVTIYLNLTNNEEGVKMKEFIDYVISFYGHGEIYDMGASRDEILLGIGTMLERCKFEFYGDSVDREKVRDIILEMRERVAA